MRINFVVNVYIFNKEDVFECKNNFFKLKKKEDNVKNIGLKI